MDSNLLASLNELKHSVHFNALSLLLQHLSIQTMDALEIAAEIPDLYRLQGKLAAYRDLLKEFADLDLLRSLPDNRNADREVR